MMISHDELDKLSALLRPRSITVKFEGVSITTKPVSPPVRFAPVGQIPREGPGRIATVREVTRTHLRLTIPAAIPAAGEWIVIFGDWAAKDQPGPRYRCRVESARRESELVKVVNLAWVAEDEKADLTYRIDAYRDLGEQERAA